MTDGDGAYDTRACDAALARAFGFLGKRWNGVLLATLLSGPAGFAELKRAIAGISDSVLSERLTELASAGLVQRSVTEGPPVGVTYELTASGQALLPALRELTMWAEQNFPAEQEPPKRPRAARRRATGREPAQST